METCICETCQNFRKDRSLLQHLYLVQVSLSTSTPSAAEIKECSALVLPGWIPTLVRDPRGRNQPFSQAYLSSNVRGAQDPPNQGWTPTVWGLSLWPRRSQKHKCLELWHVIANHTLPLMSPCLQNSSLIVTICGTFSSFSNPEVENH